MAKKKNYKETLSEISEILESKGIKKTSQEVEDIYNNRQSVQVRDIYGNGYFNERALNSKNVAKNILGTTTDLGLGIAQGFGNVAEGLGDLLTYGAAGIIDAFGDKDWAEGVREEAKKNDIDNAFNWVREKPLKNITKTNSLLGKKSQGITQGIGTMGTLLLTGGAAGAAGLGTIGSTVATTGLIGASSMGSGMSEAYQGGATDDEAFKYGLISGLAEAGSEMLFGGLGKGAKAIGLGKGLSSVDDMFAKSLASKFKSQLAKNLTEFTIKAGAEGAEEVISGFAQAVGKKLTYMKDEDLGKLIKDEDLLDQFIAGAVTSGLAQTPGLVKITKSGRDYITGNTANEQKVIDKEIDNRIKEQEEDGTKLSNKEKNRIAKQVQEDLQKGYISTKTIEDTLGYNEGYNKLKYDTENSLGRNVNANEDADLQLEARERFRDSIKNDDYLLRSYEENAKAGQKFNVSEEDMKKMSDAEKKIYQKAMDSELNNQGRTHDFVKMVAKISADKGIDFDFSNNEKIANSSFALKNLETKINNMIEEKQNKLGRPLTENEVKDIRLQVASMVNGFENNGTITLNMNSSKTLSKVMGHEITHILEGTDMYDALAESVREYAKSKNDARLKDISDFNKMYSDVENANLSKELTADLVGDYIFTDQEFVNRLSTQNRNLFQKIFDEIKYMLRIATAGSKEARQLEKAKKMFEEAYRQNSVKAAEQQNAVSPKYSIIGINGIYNLNDSKFKNTALEKYDEAQKMAGDKIKNEEIRRKTHWFQDKYGKWKYELNDNDPLNDVHLILENAKPNTEKNITEVFNHNMLFKLYPELKDYTIRFEELPKNKKGSHYYAKKIITINNSLLENGEYTEIEGSLLHELQHAIQNIEGFNTGTSRKLSGKAYYTRLGEIEADDTKQRYLKKMDKVDREMIAPESSKKNPKHSEYDNYIKNRKAIDKVKDTLYPFFEGAIENAKKNQKINGEIKRENNSVVDGGINESNTRFSLSQDSQGRELSKEQQEYFKDSKAVDENGNLEVMYHTTPSKFTVFDNSKLGENTEYDNTVFGFFVTPNSEFSNRFGDINNEGNKSNTMELYANVTNPITHPYNADYKYSGDELDNIVERYFEAIGEEEGLNELKSYVDDGDYDNLYEAYMNTVVTELSSPFENSDYEKQLLEENGYDAVEFVEGNESNVIDGGQGNEPVISYAVFNSNQLKNVDNTNPTESNDIRYSISNVLSNNNIVSSNDINNDFFKEHESEFDKNNGKTNTLYDNYGDRIKQTINVYKLAKGDNLAKLSTTTEQNVEDNYGKLYIDEIYVKDKGKGLGTEIINSLKQYAKENNLDIYTMKELSNPETQQFWNKITEQDFGLDRTSRQLYSPYQPGYNISKTDSNGNKLSYQQRQYFKDSKVVDENRNLRVMYHGTPNNFTVFDRDYAGRNGTWLGRGFYLTPSEENARGYAGDKGNVIKSYVNITNPYIPTQDVINKDGTIDFAPSFYDDFANRFKDQLPTDWNEINNFQKGSAVRNILQDNGYDGVIAGDTYVAFESNQIKNANNEAPTNNPDIRYSLSSTGEMVDNEGNKVTLEASDVGPRGTLMAIHNLNEEKFNGILDLGGFPYPSIAVTKPSSISHEGYGDGSAIFNKDTIDPELNSKNKVYSRDAYTPRFPSVEYKINSEEKRNIRNLMGEYDYRNVTPGDEYISEGWSILDNLEDSINRSGLDKALNDIKNSDAMKYIYLKNTNPEFKVETKNEQYSNKYDNETLQRFLDNYNGEYDLNNIPSGEMNKIVPQMLEAYKEQIEKKYSGSEYADNKLHNTLVEMALKNLEEKFYEQDNFIKAAYKLQQYGTEKQVLDKQATREKLDSEINKEEYEKWVDNLFSNIIEKRGLRNNKDYYTSSGNPRSFEQLHDEYNLENVVKIMDSLNDTGEEGGFFYGISEIAGNASKRFNTIEDIKANENLLTTLGDEEYSKILEGMQERLSNIQESIMERGQNNSDNYFIARNNMASAIADAARIYGEGKKIDTNKIQKMLKDYGFEATIEESEQILNMFEEMRNLPTQYFEAKPKRAVTFDELGMMVIPNSWSQQTKQRMLDNNIPYTEYNPSIEGDRQRVINQFDDLKFSLSNGQEQTELAKGSYNVPMKDYLVQKEPIQQVNDSINQLADKITQLQEQLNELGRPTQLSDEKAITEQYAEAPTSEEAPVRENMTQSQSEELDFLEDYFKDYMKNNDIKNESELATEMSTNFATDADKQLYSMYKELKDIENGVFEEQVADDEIVSRGLSDRELGKRKVKAYQYEHPEVKPYFQEQAKALLSELNESTFGERSFDSETYYNTDGELGWNGTKRDTSESLAKFKDSNNYTWEEIRQGLEDIINDNGAENNAVSKKLELVIDDRLRNGYKNFGLDAMYMGDRTPANREYINLLNNIQMEEAFSNIPMSEIDTSEDITEGNDLSQAVHGTANEIKRLELALAMKNAKGLDETIQKNVDKLEEKITKPDNLMDMFYPESRKPINQAPERPTITKTPTRKLIDNLKGMFVNENVEIDNLAKEYKRPDIKWAGDMVNNAFAEGQNDVTIAQTDNQGNAIGKSVNQLFQPAIDEGLYDAFNDYLINYSNIDRHNNGKGSQTPLNVSQNLVKAYEESYPQFKEWGKDVWNYGKNTRDNMLEAGLIDQNFHDLLGEMYPHYVPYISDVENINNYMQDVGEIKPRGIKKAYGKAGKLLPVQEALTKYTFSMKKGIRQNALYNKIVDTLRGGQEAQLATDDRTDYTNLDNGIYHDKNGAYLTAYENGIARNVRISEDLYNGLKNDLKNQVKNLEEKLSLITNPLQKLSNIKRNVLTSWSPTFPIKNAIKDFQGALFNSKHTAKMLKNYPGAIKELSTMSSPQVKQFVALYGSGNLMGQFDEGSYKSLGKNKFLRGISKANEVIELAPRYAEFKASIESGATLEEAMYNAREVTTNFSRGGTITKALNRNGFTFLNSSVQGFDKFVRNFSGENGAKGVVSALLKATMFGVAPALFNDLVFGSGDDKDEDYEALPNYIKDNYYLIKTGDNKFVRIPKGREFSVFGSAARRALEAANGDENAFDGFLKNAWDQIGVGDLEQNNIIAPLLQAYGSKNGNAWYGGDIVPTRLQDKPAGEQTDSSIDAVSTWLGEKLGISPYKLNYVIDQYTGGVGDLLLPLITPEAKSEGGFFAPITDQFTSNSTMKNKYASDFYTKLDELKVKKNSSNATDEDALRYQYMSGISSEMGKLYTEKREIQASDLSKADKYAQVQEIQKQINELAKVGLEGYNNISAENNYAEVGDDMGYYKNSKGNWTAIPQTDIRETESIGLTDKEKSTYYQTKNSIYNITENYKEKSANATDEQKTILNAEKKRDIINQIQSSNLPDNGKAILYDKYYGSTDKINAVIDSEVKFDSYLDLQKQNFTADKDKNGKAINGTKKAKVFNYINSMNIPYIEKCILAKLEYKTFRDADRDIIEYLDKNPNITYDEMVDTLKAMGFEVNGNQVK